MISYLRKKISWLRITPAVLALLAGLSLIACSQPDDPISSTPIDAVEPTITGHPQNGTFDVGDQGTENTFSLTVTATSSDGGSLSCQWYSNTSNSNTGGSILSGKTAATLTLNKADYTTAEQNGDYYFYAEVTNTLPHTGDGGKKTATAVSNVATVSVNGAGGTYLINAAQPSISTQPQSGTWNVETQNTHGLTVAASVNDGGTLSYQWYSNTSNSSTGGSPTGTNSASLILNKTDYTENGPRYFYVVVTNMNNGATGNKTAARTSNVATVTVSGNGGIDYATGLSNGVWEDGELTTALRSAEYTFDVESGKTYYVWWNDRPEGPTPKDKTMDVRVSARYSDETDEYLFGGGVFGGVDNGWINAEYFTADKTASVTVIVTPFSEYATNGTFAVVYSTASIRPGAAVPSGALTVNQWKDNTISTDQIQVYTISVTSGATYYLWWNERGNYGDGNKTADVQVQARYADDTLIFHSASLYADQWADTAWTTPRTFTASRNGTVDLRVRPYAGSTAVPGTYGIVYSTSNERPLKDSATLISVSPNGTPGTPTTSLTLEFDKVVNGLSASDITVTMPGSPFGVTKGALSGDGPEYTLGINSPIDGTVTVTVGNALLTITGSPQDVAIYADPTGITLLVEDQWANGNLQDVNDIDWYRITVTAGTTYRIWWDEKGNNGDGVKTADVVVGAWSADGTNIFGNSNSTVDSGWLDPQDFTPTANGTVYVRVRSYGASNSSYLGTYGVVYSTGTTRPAIIYPPDTPVTLVSVTANGGSGTPTTALTLTFSAAIPGLSADDITLSMSGSLFSLTKGNLSGAGTTYTLGISSPVNGTVTVTVEKRFYVITPTKEVNIYGDGSIRPLTAGVWANGNLPASNSVDWYSITVTAGTTYRIWWNDEDAGNGTKTGDVGVMAYNSDGTTLTGWITNGYEPDEAWYTPKSYTPTANDTIYLRVHPYNDSSMFIGTYGIVYTADNATRPAP
jgi:uncharacterized protein YodC (DUF2158 family)